MDIETLQQTLNNHITGSVFNLDSSSLASTEVTQLFALYLPTQQLGLTTATIMPIEDATITVNGIGSVLPFTNMTIQAVFSIVNGAVELLVTATAYSDWTLPDSFPAWQHKFSPSLQFTTLPQLQLSTSHAAPNNRYGLFFSGMLDTQSVMGPFAWLISNQPSLLLQGEISMNGVVPQTVLSTDSKATQPKTLGFLELTPIVLEVATDDDAIANPSPLSPPIVLHFTTSIAFVTSTGTIAIPLRANFNGQDLISFDADLNQVVSASLEEFSSLLNNIDISKPDLIPQGLELEKIIKLKFLTFQLAIDGSPQLKMISIGVEKQGDPWQITSDIAIDDISINFALNDPLGLKYLTVALYGSMTIGAGELDIDAVYPDFTLSGQLKDGTEINLLEIIDQFCGTSEASNDGMDAIEVTEFDFSLTPSPLSYMAAITLDGNWFVSLIDEVFFEMSELSFSLNKPADTNITGSLAATANIAGVDISISASQPEADGGWTFTGSTGPNQAIAIGTLIADLVDLFGDITLPSVISDLIIENLHITFNTNTTDFAFTCESKLPVDNEMLDITVMVGLKDGDSGYTKNFSGHISIGSLLFDLQFMQNAPSTIFVATYSHTGTAQNISVKDLLANISTDIASVIPADLNIDLKDVVFAFSKDDAGSTFLLALDISATIPSLTNLPLIGKELPTDQTIAINDLQIVVVSQDIKQALVQSVNALIPQTITHLATSDLGAGLSLAASMTIGNTPQVLAVPVVGTGTTATPAPQPSVTAGNNAKWFALQKSFGPIDFNRIGVQYKDAAIWFLLDAALSAFGLTISLEGLAFGSSLSKFAPTFSLQGLGIDYTGGDVVEITGAFLNAGNDEFIGEALIRTSELTLSALGSYASLNGSPSLFVYAFLDQSIGGPAFFFVTGLAAGFGYNRTLIVPAIEQVSQFPLIEEVMSGTHLALGDELKALDHFIPPSMGDIFFAIGVRFTSFKIIESFALLTVALGNRVEIAVLGLSTLISPPPEEGENIPPLAEIYMALKASFSPEEGFLGINALLTSASYLFSKDCHLTGGFAFYSWFAKEHAGDFVITLGGYHPAFIVPSHYPTVPRLGFSWQVDSNLLIKGNIYFALTASALMAGGSLQVTWNSGPFKAWFSAGADFLLSWKPYHYDASFYVNIGASYTFELIGTHHITVDVGASVHMWGPDFSGLAHIDLSIISFDIAFGSGSNKAPDPIDWPTFEKSFLPEVNAVCSIAAKSGLISAPQTGAIQWILNPKDFVLTIGTVIPISSATFNQQAISDVQPAAFGIGSMAVTTNDLASKYEITITKDSVPVAEGVFDHKPVLKNMPVGMWGQELQTDLNAAAFIPNALVGFEISPKQPVTTGDTVEIDASVLHFTPDPLANSYTWHSPTTFQATSDTEDARRARISETIATPATVSARNVFLDAFSLTGTFDVGADVASAFLIAPQIASV